MMLISESYVVCLCVRDIVRTHCSRTTHHSIKIGSLVAFVFVRRESGNMWHANAPERSYKIEENPLLR